MQTDRCGECKAPAPSYTLTGVGTFCDRCADKRIAALTGWPASPDPPGPLVIIGPDRRKHTLRFQLWRAPTGVSVDLVEQGPGQSAGYEFRVLGPHDANVAALVEYVRQQAITEINRPNLSRDRHTRQWAIGDRDEVAGGSASTPMAGRPGSSSTDEK